MPIESEIEAAAKAMIVEMFAPHELPVADELWYEYLQTARAALEAAEQARWQPIVGGPDEARAPWDGKPVLILTDHKWCNCVHRAIWTDAIHGHGIHGWAVEDCKFGPYALRGYMNVTHWQSLPAPPVE